MKHLKIILASLLAVLAVICGASCSRTSPLPPEDALLIVAANFPAYDFARQLTADTDSDTVIVELLVPPGSESHSYEPTPRDILRLERCDLFICTGGENDAWAEDIIAAAEMEESAVLRMTECVELLAEEHVEGMSDVGHGHGEDNHVHDGDCEHTEKITNDHIHDESCSHTDADHAADTHFRAEYDEHVWTSPLNAKLICAELASRLCRLDPDRADIYTASHSSYAAELDVLDAEIRAAVDAAATNLLIFGDRFPFRYFAEEYSLDYYAAFPGCSSSTEPGASTVAFLIDRARKLSVPVIFHIELTDAKIASAIAEESDASVALLHSCHNVTLSDFQNGETYLSLMRRNVEVLRGALQCGTDEEGRG